MNCMIIDDDEMSRNALKHLIDQVGFLVLVKECKDPIEAVEFLKDENPELIFLDIEMPGMSGIDFLKNFTVRPKVILTTTHTEYALDAFDFSVVDYLVKPLSLPRFVKAVSKAKETSDHSKSQLASFEADHFFVKKNSILHKVPLKEIQWIEALGDYVTINTPTSKYTLHFTLKALEAKLPSNKFIRVHRSFMVNFENISSIEDTMISIDKKLIPIGALYRENFIKKLNLL